MTMEVDGKSTSGPVRNVQASKVKAEAQALVATVVQHNYYQSGAARARHEVFMRRGWLTRELTTLGLPPVYEHAKGIVVGQQVFTQPEATNAAEPAAHAIKNNSQRRDELKQKKYEGTLPPPATAPWRQIRTQAANPARNPVMARNLRVKARLVTAATRGAAAAKPKRRKKQDATCFGKFTRAGRDVQVHCYTSGGMSVNMWRFTDEAAICNATYRPWTRPVEPSPNYKWCPPRRSHGGWGEICPMGSAPLSKPYYPRKLRGGVPANETEGGDLWPSRLARRVVEQQAEEEQRAVAQVLRGPVAVERRRQAQIYDIADVIVAAPQLGLRELGVYTTHELVKGMHASAAVTTPPALGATSISESCTASTVPVVTTAAGRATKVELSEALRQLELCAAAGRAAITSAEDDYGSHYATPLLTARAGRAAVAIPVLSPIASSYASGGHYLYDEGMAENYDDVDVESAAGNSEDVYDVAPAGVARDLSSVETDAQPQSGLDAGATGGGGAVRERQPPPTPPLTPSRVMAESNPEERLVVVRYPVSSGVQRKREWAQAPDGVRQAALERSAQIGSSMVAAVKPYNLEALQRADLQIVNEVAGGRAGGRTHHGPTTDNNSSTHPAKPPEAVTTSDATGGGALAPAVSAATATTTTTQQSVLSMKASAGTRVGTVVDGAGDAVQVSFNTSQGPLPETASVPPPWRGESLVKRTADLISAAVAAAPEDALANVVQQPRAQGISAVPADRGPKVAVRASQPRVAAAVTESRKVPAPGSNSKADTQEGLIDRWGGKQIGRTVATAVQSVPITATATITDTLPTPSLPAGTAIAAAVLPVPVAGFQAAQCSAVTNQGNMDMAEHAAVFRRLMVDGEGPSLDRFGMLSDIESEEADDDLPGEQGWEWRGVGEGVQRSLTSTREQIGGRWHGQGRSHGLVTDDPRDSSSDDDNPWGVEDADDLGYPVGISGVAEAGGDSDLPALQQPSVAAVQCPGPPPAISKSKSRPTLPHHHRDDGRGPINRDQLQPGAAALGGVDETTCLRELFGLGTHERVVEPWDTAPLPLTPPPEWLLGRPRVSKRRDLDAIQ